MFRCGVNRILQATFILTTCILSEHASAITDNTSLLDLYGGTPVVLPSNNTVDLTLKKEALYIKLGKEKTLGSDTDDFIRSSLLAYSFIWMERVYISPSNFRKLITTSFPEYLYNITGWQGCRGAKARRGLCSPKRKSFLNPPVDDGDPFLTNYIEHPLVGMTYYLYYRARGYDRRSSIFGSFMLSTLFEYTVEGWQQPPSFNDLILTPGIGVPLGIILEESSNWLAKRDSQFLRALSYIVNPTKILMREGEIAWGNALGISFRFNAW